MRKGGGDMSGDPRGNGGRFRESSLPGFSTAHSSRCADSAFYHLIHRTAAHRAFRASISHLSISFPFLSFLPHRAPRLLHPPPRQRARRVQYFQASYPPVWPNAPTVPHPSASKRKFDSSTSLRSSPFRPPQPQKFLIPQPPPSPPFFLLLSTHPFPPPSSPANTAPGDTDTRARTYPAAAQTPSFRLQPAPRAEGVEAVVVRGSVGGGAW